MFEMDKKSRDKLDECDALLVTLFEEVALRLPVADITGYRIMTGFRPKEEQERAYESGASKLKWPNGKHNRSPSLAADVYPEPIPHGWNKSGHPGKKEFEERCRQFGIFVEDVAKALEIDIIWGGRWKSLMDFGHFELSHGSEPEMIPYYRNMDWEVLDGILDRFGKLIDELRAWAVR